MDQVSNSLGQLPPLLHGVGHYCPGAQRQTLGMESVTQPQAQQPVIVAVPSSWVETGDGTESDSHNQEPNRQVVMTDKLAIGCFGQPECGFCCMETLLPIWPQRPRLEDPRQGSLCLRQKRMQRCQQVQKILVWTLKHHHPPL